MINKMTKVRSGLKFVAFLFMASPFVIQCSQGNKAEKTAVKAPEKVVETAAAKPAAKTAENKMSESAQIATLFGYDVGKRIGTILDKKDMDLEVFISAFRSAFEGKESPLTDEEMQKISLVIRDKVQHKQEKLAENNLKDGLAYLAENKKKEGVKTTASGLQYKIVKAGTGKKPTDNSKVSVHYEGKHLDGKVFDSSYERGEPANFPVNGVIKGWTEALKMMPVGSVWEVAIPSELAYGKNPRPGIPANSTLVFKVELLSSEDEVAKPAVAAKPKAKPVVAEAKKSKTDVKK